MSLNPYEIRTMENAIITARGKVLTLGLGLGYYAYMVHLKEEVKESEARQLAKEKGYEFSLTSAKNSAIFCRYLQVETSPEPILVKNLE